MPRSSEQILDHADELVARFEQHEPGDAVREADTLRDLRAAVLTRADAERGVRAAVIRARHDGHSWAAIGAMLGTSGEAARQRYAQAVKSG